MDSREMFTNILNELRESNAETTKQLILLITDWIVWTTD
jgi:hypothetical protein